MIPVRMRASSSEEGNRLTNLESPQAMKLINNLRVQLPPNHIGDSVRDGLSMGDLFPEQNLQNMNFLFGNDMND